MGQGEILDFLKKSKTKWFSSKEITKNLEENLSSVTRGLAGLRKSGCVNYKYSRTLSYGAFNTILYKYIEDDKEY